MCECEEGKCSCSSNCDERGCECGSGCSEGQYSKLDMFFYLVKEAKMELLKEKMKKRLEASIGKKLDKVADVMAEALLDYYKTEGDASKKRQDLNDKLDKIFEEE